jgi:hypothetical protein
LDAGHIKEFDAPYILLKNARSIFSQLVTQTGPDEARKLYEVAREAYYDNMAIIEDQEPEIVDGKTDFLEAESPEVEIINPRMNGEAGKLLQYESNL